MKLNLFRPVPDGEPLVFKGELVDVEDKKAGALVIVKFSLYDRHNQVLNDQYLTSFIQGLGGFGSKCPSTPSAHMPCRPLYSSATPAQSSLALSPLWRQKPCEQGSSASCRL